MAVGECSAAGGWATYTLKQPNAPENRPKLPHKETRKYSKPSNFRMQSSLLVSGSVLFVGSFAGETKPFISGLTRWDLTNRSDPQPT